jgi:hypothetical protein
VPQPTNVPIALKRFANIDRHYFESFVARAFLQVTAWRLEILCKAVKNIMPPARQCPAKLDLERVSGMIVY